MVSALIRLKLGLLRLVLDELMNLTLTTSVSHLPMLAMDFSDAYAAKQLVQFTVALVRDSLLLEDVAMRRIRLVGLVLNGARIRN